MVTYLGFPLVLLLALSPPASRQESRKEQYDSGKLKSEYSVDKEGRKHGRYVEYFENGKKKLSGSYEAGLKHGEWWEYYESGPLFGRKSYAKDKVAGDILRMNERGVLLYRASVSKGSLQVFRDFKKPEPACERSLEEIRRKIAEIDPPEKRAKMDVSERFLAEPSSKAPYKAGKLKPEYLADAIRHLNVYRYLSGVRPDVKPDEGYTEHSQYAAVVVAAHGELSHTPPKAADMDTAFHAKGYKGAQASNLHRGRKDLRHAVDGFMEDPGEDNSRHVGHRAWLQNPAMGRAGFGECEGFVALWAHDGSGKPDRPELVGYPAPGYHPMEYFAKHAAWSIAPKEGRFKLPAETEITVQMWLLNDEFDFIEEVEVSQKTIATITGLGLRAVFRPVLPKNQEWKDRRVWVLISKKESPVFGYFVHFVGPEAGEKPADDGKQESSTRGAK